MAAYSTVTVLLNILVMHGTLGNIFCGEAMNIMDLHSEKLTLFQQVFGGKYTSNMLSCSAHEWDYACRCYSASLLRESVHEFS
jgi:hypothetical protein